MNLDRVAIYAGAKPEKARPTGMQIVKRDKSGKRTTLRGHDVLTHEVTPKEPKPRATTAQQPTPRMGGVVFQNTTARHYRRTNLSWED